MEIDANLCSINLHTPLYNRMEELKIHMKGGNYFDWVVKGGDNTLKIRLERMEIFKKNFPYMHYERMY